MSEHKANFHEEDYNDTIPDPEEEMPEPYEETYRDGHAKNECWEDPD